MNPSNKLDSVISETPINTHHNEGYELQSAEIHDTNDDDNEIDGAEEQETTFTESNESMS